MPPPPSPAAWAPGPLPGLGFSFRGTSHWRFSKLFDTISFALKTIYGSHVEVPFGTFPMTSKATYLRCPLSSWTLATLARISNLASLSWVMASSVFLNSQCLAALPAFKHVNFIRQITITSIFVFSQAMSTLILCGKALITTFVIIPLSFLLHQLCCQRIHSQWSNTRHCQHFPVSTLCAIRGDTRR